MDGLELLRRLREKSAIPVIFLTSKDDELDEALGLAMGADDYIAKPFSQRLLIARIRAILRRTEPVQPVVEGEEPEPAQTLERGRLTMDPARHRVTWGGSQRDPHRHRVPDPRDARPAPRRRQDTQPADGRGVPGRHLRRRPHHRQPHQARAPQVPSGRSGIRCDRDPLWRGLSFLRRDEERELRAQMVPTDFAHAAHPGGQYLRARAAGGRLLLPRFVPQPDRRQPRRRRRAAKRG